MTDISAVRKPTPARDQEPTAVVTLSVRLPAPQRETIKALAEAQGLTLQQLGEYAWNLALAAYGQPPLLGIE